MISNNFISISSKAIDTINKHGYFSFLISMKENTATVTRKPTNGSSHELDKAFHGGLLAPNQPTDFNLPERSFETSSVRHLSFHAQWFENIAGYIMKRLPIKLCALFA